VFFEIPQFHSLASLFSMKQIWLLSYSQSTTFLYISSINHTLNSYAHFFDPKYDEMDVLAVLG
jgi:hypothetical protein